MYILYSLNTHFTKGFSVRTVPGIYQDMSATRTILTLFFRKTEKIYCEPFSSFFVKEEGKQEEEEEEDSWSRIYAYI